MTPVVLNLCPPCLCTQNKARHLRQKWKGTNNNKKNILSIYKACLFLLDTICRSISRAIFLTPSCARTQPRLPMFTNIEGVYRGRSHIAPKNAWKTLGALLSPFFPKRSGSCAPEAFVVAKQPSAALSVTRRCGALDSEKLRCFYLDAARTRLEKTSASHRDRVASIMSAHTVLLHLK